MTKDVDTVQNGEVHQDITLTLCFTERGKGLRRELKIKVDLSLNK
jgi:hypothetical protein